MLVWFLILIWDLRIKCLAYVKHPFFKSVIYLVYESIWGVSLWSMCLSPVGWIMGMHCCTDFLNISLQNFKLFWIAPPIWLYANRNMTMQLLCWSSFIVSVLVSALFLRSYYWHVRRLNGLVPMYITELLDRYAPPRPLWSSFRGLLKVPRSNTKYGDRSFSVCAPTLWNSLPDHLRLTTDLCSFKRDLKTYLVSRVLSLVSIPLWCLTWFLVFFLEWYLSCFLFSGSGKLWWAAP